MPPPIHWTGDAPPVGQVSLVLLRLFPDTTTGSLAFVRVDVTQTVWDGEAVRDFVQQSVRPAVTTLLNRTASSVAELLDQSRAAHTLYRSLNALNRLDVPPQRAAVLDAQTTRLQAQAADPDHLDPAWSLDAPVNNAALLAFYNTYLASH